MAEGFRLSHVVIVALAAGLGEEPLYQEQHGFEREPKDFDEAVEMDGRFFNLDNVRENGVTDQGQTRLIATYVETSSRPGGARIINGRLPPKRVSASALRSGSRSSSSAGAFAKGTEAELGRLRESVDAAPRDELAAKDDEIARLRQQLADAQRQTTPGGNAPQQG